MGPRPAAANRDPQLAIHRPPRPFANHYVRSEVEAEAVAEVGDGAAADVTAFLEDRDVAAAASEVDRGRKTGDAAADNDDILLHDRAMLSHTRAKIAANASVVTFAIERVFVRIQRNSTQSSIQFCREGVS